MRSAVRAVLGCAVVAATLLGVVHSALLLRHVTGWEAAGWIVAGLLLGAAVADLVSGLVHWACDTWGDERTPWLGPGLIAHFREHHRRPRAMTGHDWIEVNGEVSLAACLAWVLFGGIDPDAWLQPPRGEGAVLGVHAALVGLIGVGALTNQLHKWAHTRRPPRPVRWLQRMGLVLSSARHARHHRGDHARGYCITTGWLNGPLDGAGLWRGLEGAVALLVRRRPAREGQHTV